MRVPWQTALAVFSFLRSIPAPDRDRVREQIVNGMPDCLKHSTATGIGMFIAFVGLRNAKLVVANPATFVGLGNFSDKEVQTACFGLVLTLILVGRKVTVGFWSASSALRCWNSARPVALAFCDSVASASLFYIS